MKNAIARATALMVRPLLRGGAPRRLRARLHREIWRWINWRGLEFVARTEAGARMRLNSCDLIQQYIFWFGVWEPNLTAFLNRILRPGDTFVDVGANIGYFTLLAARRVGPTGHVVAIDAAPPIFGLLQANLAMNETAMVRAVNAAVTGETGDVTITMGPDDNIGQTSLGGGTGKAYRVAGEPLTNLLTPDELAAARAFKIDVEGAEAPVLNDLATHVDRLRHDVAIIVEISPAAFQASGLDLQAVLDRFTNRGFVPYRLANSYGVQEYIDRDHGRPPERIETWPAEQFDLLLVRGMDL